MSPYLGYIAKQSSLLECLPLAGLSNKQNIMSKILLWSLHRMVRIISLLKVCSLSHRCNSWKPPTPARTCLCRKSPWLGNDEILFQDWTLQKHYEVKTCGTSNTTKLSHAIHLTLAKMPGKQGMSQVDCKRPGFRSNLAEATAKRCTGGIRCGYCLIEMKTCSHTSTDTQ